MTTRDSQSRVPAQGNSNRIDSTTSDPEGRVLVAQEIHLPVWVRFRPKRGQILPGLSDSNFVKSGLRGN